MKKRSSNRFRLAVVLLVFFACAFLLPASRTGDIRLYLLAAAVPAGMLILLFFPGGAMFLDRPSLAAGLILCGFSILAPVSVLPAVLVRSFRPSFPAAVLVALCGLGMLSAPQLLPSLGLSLAEGGIALLLFAVAAFLSLRLCLPALLVSLGGLLLLLLHQDPGSAAVWCVTFLLVFWAASGSALWSGITLGCTAGLFGGFLLLQQDLLPLSASSSDASLLPRFSAMPLIPPETPPQDAAASDSLFLLLGDSYGLVFLLCSLLLILLLLLRGTSLALHSRKAFHAAVALGVVLLFGLRTLLFLVYALNLFPLPVVEFPFLTSSLPSLCAAFFLLGLLSGISGRNEADLEEDTRLAMLAH